MNTEFLCPSIADVTASTAIWKSVLSKTPFPVFAAIELTHRCNLVCPHCYLAPTQIESELSKNEVVSILGQLEEMGILVLTLTGGEPTCRKDLLEIIQEAIRRHFVVILKTNALTLDPETIQELAVQGLYELNVSLYHSSPAEHDRFVGKRGAWDAAVNALRSFSAKGKNVKVALLVMGWNIDSTLELERFCRKESWPYSIDFRIEPRNDGNCQPMNLQAPSDKLLQLMQESPLLRSIVANRRKINEMPNSICGMGRSTIVIHADGSVTPCISLSRIVMGNIRQASLADIWIHSEVRRKVTSLNRRDQPRCTSCELVSDCPRCPATGFNEHGDLLMPSALDCQLAEVWRQARLSLEKHGK